MQQHLNQSPAPGSYHLAYAGGVITIELDVPSSEEGSAWLRTNVGNGVTRLNEIVAHVEQDSPILARDWHDVPRRRIAARRHSVTVPLTEIGRFEGKAFFLPQGSDEPVWPAGKNVVIKVEPAQYCCGNSIYTAFVRQFGPNKSGASVPPGREQLLRDLEEEHYSVIPKSGTFRNVVRELDFIVNELRFGILLLLPIHPTPTTYARMGRFGSPFAVMDFMDVDPALAEFDRSTTPMGQFGELTDAVHARAAKLFIDIPINHTGWASHLQITHPEWFARGHDRTFQSPGAWGVTWEDLAKLDYANKGLWKYMADVFLFWCDRGVDGFRCDAGYMIPAPVWRYIVAKVRLRYPDTVFLLEGLGGEPSVVEALLDGANLDWAYSELFQNYDRQQVSSYLPGTVELSATKGTLIHFAETHDNDRLAAVSKTYARMRTALAAMCTQNGGFGITNGLEWFADEKVDVHGASSLSWGAQDNLVDHIRRLNTVLRLHPAFRPGAGVRLVHAGQENAVAVLRRDSSGGHALLVAVNLDTEQPVSVEWKRADFEGNGNPAYDLLSGRRVEIERGEDCGACRLAPGETLCLTHALADLQALETGLAPGTQLPDCCTHQRLLAKALEVHVALNPGDDMPVGDVEDIARELATDASAYCTRCAQPQDRQAPGLSPVVPWKWPRDIKRTVMLPPGKFLLVTAPGPFVAELRCGKTEVFRRESSLPADDGTHFGLFPPLSRRQETSLASLILQVHEQGGPARAQGAILVLAPGSKARIKTSLTRQQAEELQSYALCTNGAGAMSHVRSLWGNVRSKYDALLAGNLDPDFPVDRQVMFTRCRTWLVCRGYSHDLDRDSLEHFSVDREGIVTWRFCVPACEGRVVRLDIHLKMHSGVNAVGIAFRRRPSSDESSDLADEVAVKVIVRPDIEDRTAHAITEARRGPAESWPGAIEAGEQSFTFAPAPGRQLRIAADQGCFTPEPEWTHAVPHPVDGERGLDGSSDLFSPGYFSFDLEGNQTANLAAEIRTDGRETGVQTLPVCGAEESCAEQPLEEALERAMRQFIVRREDLHTVIAGYPWFLDWGRDTLICLRGMIAAGAIDDARNILVQFARFESHGTLPNVIHGQDASNRETSDAPLWFFIACRDLVEAEADSDLLNVDCGGRTLREVLASIARNYIAGTPNGIVMDADSGLVFSPSHFTWMDTNHPAGTPRQGYPVEIQSLWYAALAFLSRVDPGAGWPALGEQVRASIIRYFPLNRDRAFLSDCLHAERGQTARQATADDHLRPNQLLAITLGAVGDKSLGADILRSCEELLVPGAIRSLADRPVEYRLNIERHGEALNNPARPYWGDYRGDEDTRRKPAYHNGTAWTWPMPSYCEALYVTYGAEARDTALALIASCTSVMNRGCIGQVPEVVDGDTPHTLRGCGAQAWGVTEFYRVHSLLRS